MSKKIFRIFFTVFCLLALYGCGRTNVLQWAAPAPKEDNIVQARAALDKANYDRAISLLDNDTSDEGRIIYAEALLGKAGIDLVAIVDALDDNSVTDNPIIQLDKLMHGKNNLHLILESGNIFLKITPDEKSDRIIGVISTLIAHTANLKQAFDKNDEGLKEVTDTLDPSEDVSANYKLVCGVTDNITDLTASLRYVNRASELLALSFKEENITDALKKMQDTMLTVNATIILEEADWQNKPIPWRIVKALFGL